MSDTTMLTTDGRAVKSRSTFRMEVGVAINVRATPKRLWSVLTNASDFARWNSTVQRIDGTIAAGQTIQVRVKVSDRVFKLKVGPVVDENTMVWSDGMAPMFKGVRTFTLTAKDDGTTDFRMAEVFSGIMLPMLASSLPDFVPLFETYAADLKREAERASD